MTSSLFQITFFKLISKVMFVVFLRPSLTVWTWLTSKSCQFLALVLGVKVCTSASGSLLCFKDSVFIVYTAVRWRRLWFRQVKCDTCIQGPSYTLVWRKLTLRHFLWGSRDISSLSIIALAVFRDIGPLERKRCYIFDSFSLPLSETIKINMKLSAWPVRIMPFACDFLCSPR